MRQHNEFSPEVWGIFLPAIKVGALSGATGLIVGALGGILRSTSPTLFALASGIQWSLLGATFTASRGLVARVWGEKKPTSTNEIWASVIAGGVSGSACGLLRGRANVIPGAIVFALGGGTGQALYDRIKVRRMDPALTSSDESEGKKSWMKSQWSPVKVLSDAEYEAIMREKLLRIEADIALVDEKIKTLTSPDRQSDSGKVVGKSTAK